MGLMDKVKAQATQLAQKTQDAASTGMAKFDAAQMARRYDPMLKSLGLAVLAERTGRGAPDSQAQIEQMIAGLTQFEAQNSVNIVEHAQQAAAQAQSQAGGGQFLSATQQPFDPNVQATMPEAAPGDVAGFPGAGQPTSFPGADPAPATGFPEAAPPSFPEAAPSTGFPEAAPATGFPEAAPSTGFPAADEEQPGEFPGGPTGFPPASGT